MLTTKTRFKLTFLAALFLGAMALVSTFRDMEVMATTCIASIMTILSTYIWAQTRRPSGFRSSTEEDEDTPDENHRAVRLRSSFYPDGYADGVKAKDAQGGEQKA